MLGLEGYTDEGCIGAMLDGGSTDEGGVTPLPPDGYTPDGYSAGAVFVKLTAGCAAIGAAHNRSAHPAAMLHAILARCRSMTDSVHRSSVNQPPAANQATPFDYDSSGVISRAGVGGQERLRGVRKTGTMQSLSARLAHAARRFSVGNGSVATWSSSSGI